MKHLIKKSTLFILIIIASLFAKTNAVAQVSLQIAIAPPMMPVYEQPACPVDGYIWTPGYWAYGDGGYYWVEGVWLYPAQPNFLWTPGYWGYAGGYYGWNVGYWGPHIGYYGGVCYGHGYDGEGYSGGRWESGSFRYNTEVSNVNANVVRNTYADKSEIQGNSGNRSSFNGEGGITAKPTENERVAMNENHVKPNAIQVSHEQTANKNNHSSAPIKNTVANKQTRAVNTTPTKTNVVHKQQNNVPQQNKQVNQQRNVPQQQRQAPVQHNNQPVEQHAQQQQHQTPVQQNNQAVQQQRNAPQQQRSAPQQHSQAPQGGGGGRKK
jgi:YXWGXW repeat-containing protein